MARAEDIRAFARRDWSRATAAKRTHWASMSPSERFRIAQSLWEHACAQLPGWPDAASRAEDFADHLELARKLDAVAHVLARR